VSLIADQRLLIQAAEIMAVALGAKIIGNILIRKKLQRQIIN